ncbi:glycosyltransferase family 4 protein [Patescibacteria group bacterium]
MKIAIDISQVIYGTGVSVYTKYLIKNLLKIDKENEYVLFGGSLRRKQDILDIFPSSMVFSFPPKLADLVWNRLHILPLERFIGKVDVYHSSDWAQAPANAFKVTTVHDLIPLKFPRMIHSSVVEAHRRRLNRVKQEVDRIIVPSLATKKDLIEIGVREEKIRVTPEASSIKPATKKEVEIIKRKHNISGEYLLAISSVFYKNTESVVKAFDLSSAGKDLKLVIVGRQSNTQIGQRRGVRLTGFVGNSEYAALCTGAKVLVFPSLYEGFGIPILDAFVCGTPVVTSNISSMPEVAGDAAVLVDPYEIQSIADGIKKALSSPKALIAKGKKQAIKFSWRNTAEETLSVYKES